MYGRCFGCVYIDAVSELVHVYLGKLLNVQLLN